MMGIKVSNEDEELRVHKDQWTESYRSSSKTQQKVGDTQLVLRSQKKVDKQTVEVQAKVESWDCIRWCPQVYELQGNNGGLLPCNGNWYSHMQFRYSFPFYIAVAAILHCTANTYQIPAKKTNPVGIPGTHYTAHSHHHSTTTWVANPITKGIVSHCTQSLNWCGYRIGGSILPSNASKTKYVLHFTGITKE